MSKLGRVGKSILTINPKIILLSLGVILSIALLLFVGAAVLYFFVLSEREAVEKKSAPVETTRPEQTVQTVPSSTSTTSTSSTTTTSSSTYQPTTSTTPKPVPTCRDGIENQGEVGVDCGGPCGECVDPIEVAAYCLASKGVRLYVRGDSICSQCKSIKNHFGENYPRLDSIDCDDSGNENECADMLETASDDGVRQGFPTWEVYGKLYPGASISSILTVAGC